MEAQEPKRRRGAHFKAAQQDAAREVEESSEVADDVEESAKKAPVHAVPDGFCGARVSPWASGEERAGFDRSGR